MHSIVDISEHAPACQSCVTTTDSQANNDCNKAKKAENSLGRLLSCSKLGGTSIDATM